MPRGRPRRPPGGWRAVSRVANQWVVETDWWRTPVRRHYVRLLLEGRGGGRQDAGPGRRTGGAPRTNASSSTATWRPGMALVPPL